MTSPQHWQEAERAYRAGRHEQARALYTELAAHPAYAAHARFRLLELDYNAGALRRATAEFLQLHPKLTTEPTLLAAACRLAFQLGETRLALASAESLLDAGAPVPLLAQTAMLLSDWMEPRACLRLLAGARHRGLPRTAGAAYLEGLNAMYLGDLDHAARMLQEALDLDPNFVPTYWAHAKLRRADRRSERIDYLRKLHKALGEAHADTPLVLYSLFQELDANDDIQHAWPVLCEALRTRRAQVRHSEADERALFQSAADGIRRWAAADPVAPGSHTSGPRPIMIVGLPRTGTTVVEQSLCREYSVVAAGELRDFVFQMRWSVDLPGPPHPDPALMGVLGDPQLAEVGNRYLHHTQWRAGGADAYIDKWPENYLIAAAALASIPSLRVLALRRGAMDACWSNLKEWFGNSYYYSYEFEAVARRWVRYDMLVELLQASFPERVLIVNYEEFVAAPSGMAAKLAGWLSLPEREFARTGSDAVVATASTVQVRQGVSTRHVEQWRRYAQYLAPLEAEVERAQRQLSKEAW